MGKVRCILLWCSGEREIERRERDGMETIRCWSTVRGREGYGGWSSWLELIVRSVSRYTGMNKGRLRSSCHWSKHCRDVEVEERERLGSEF